jgi:hypothetical protein
MLYEHVSMYLVIDDEDEDPDNGKYASLEHVRADIEIKYAKGIPLPFLED